MSEYRLEMCDVVKTFPGVKALNHAQLKLKPGTVHALMGENGAGKSTLMKCMFGIYHMDEGKVIYEGQEVQIKGPLDALNRGIAMVHQELQPIPERSIGENIYVGRYPTKKYGPVTVIDHDKMYEDAAKVLKEVHLNYDPHAKLGTLSVSQMQLVEIAKAVSADCKVLILDEPTSSLTAAEVEALFTIVNELRAKGVSIVYISHKMDEILRISDEVTIMRDGQYIGTWEAKELTTDMIITKMVGRELSNLYPPRSNTPGEVVFEVKDFTSINPKSFRHVNFNVRKGEILGVAGLVGAQRTELMEGLFGLRCHTSGTITYKGKELTINQPQDAIKNGIADIAVVTTPTLPSAMTEEVTVRKFHEVAVCSAAFSELLGEKVGFAELLSYPMISLGTQTKSFELYSEFFAEEGLHYHPETEAATADQILPMVKADLGIGFIPREFLQGVEGVFVIETEKSLPEREIRIVKRHEQTLSIAAKELERLILKPQGTQM